MVSFCKTVTLGSHGRDGWSLASEVGSPNTGRLTCTDKGDRLTFDYRSGDVHQQIDVPIGNVSQITRVMEAGDETKPTKGAK